jgi:hypothetical protein
MLTTSVALGKMVIRDYGSYPVYPRWIRCVYTSPWGALEKVGALKGELVGIGSPV